MSIQEIKLETVQIISKETNIENKGIVDEGFLFGIGFFETILIKDKACFLEEHVGRINESLRQFDIDKKITVDVIEALIKENNYRDLVLKIIITPQNTFAMTRQSHYTQKHYEEGVKLCLSTVVRGKNASLIRHKSLNYGECYLANRAAKAADFDDCLFVNELGHLTESTTANLFVIENDTLITPPLSDGLLPGVIRNQLIKYHTVVENSITPERLLKSQGAFLTNSIVGIIKIAEFKRQKLQTHPLVNRLYLELTDEMRSHNEL